MLSSRTWFAYGALAMVFLWPSLAESVVVLTNDNFHNEVGRDRSALIEFYAPGCGHFERLAPEYEKLGQSFKKTKSVLIGKVDCDEQKDLCTKYGFSGSPTIQWFPKGSLEPKKFEGARTEDALVEFLNREGGTNVKITAASSNVVELTPTNFNKVVDGKKCVLVEFYAPWCGPCKSLAPTYEKVATEFKSKKDIVIASVNGDAYKDLASRYGIKGYPTFKLFQKGKKTPEDYNGGRDFKDFVSFINKRCGTSKMGTEDLLQMSVLAI